jgi:tape measure domain-containing protein
MSKLEYEMTLDNSQFVSGLRAGQTALTSTTGQIGATGKAAGVATGLVNKLAGGFLLLKAAQAGLAVAKEGFFKAGALETEKVRLEVLLGSMEKADQLMADVMKKAGETPLQTEELQQAARMLIAFGSSSDTVVDELTRIGDISEGVGGGIGELAEIYGKARVQGTLFAEDINQLLNKGIPVISEFAKQLGVSESEIKKMASEGKITFANLEQAFISLTSEGGKFNGMMARMSETLEGKLSTLKDDFNALVVIPMGQWVASWIEPMIEGISASIGLLQEMRGYGAESMKADQGKEIRDFKEKSKGISSVDELDKQQADVLKALKQARVLQRAIESDPNPSRSDEWRKFYIEEHIRNLRRVLDEHKEITAQRMADRAEAKRLADLQKMAPIRDKAVAEVLKDEKERESEKSLDAAVESGDRGFVEDRIKEARLEIYNLIDLLQTTNDQEILKSIPDKIKDARKEVDGLGKMLEKIDADAITAAEKQQELVAEKAKAAAEALAESRGSLLEGARSALVLPEVTEFRKRGLGFEGDLPRQDLVKRQVDLLTKIEAELKKLNNKPAATAETGWSNG